MRIPRLFTIALAASFCMSTASIQAQSQRPAGSTREAGPADASRAIDLSTLLARTGKTMRRGFSLQPGSGAESVTLSSLAAGPGLIVMGSGTVGRLTKWAGFTSSNSFIGDTTIFEDKFGKVGIGTDSPMSKLTVAGVIESTGGFKFPDGTVQTSSAAGALSTVAHDATLTGDGTAASPLGVAAPPGEPFQRQLTIATQTGGFGGTATILVPANKRLLIEFASVRVNGFSPVSQPQRMEMTTSVGGESATYQLGPARTVLSGGINTHIASQQVVIWADPGTAVILRIEFPVSAAGFSTDFAISGRLFDVPD
jgi:hypothetical protein